MSVTFLTTMSNLEGDLSWLPVSGKAVHHSEEGGREQPLLLLLTSQGICRVLGRKQATQSQRVTSVSQATIPRPLQSRWTRGEPNVQTHGTPGDSSRRNHGEDSA